MTDKNPPPASGDDDSACADKKPADGLLRIVRAKDDDLGPDDLDLDLDEAESDRRYGREDIADK